jgi:hypothetical protein
MGNVNSVGDFIRYIFSTLVNKDDEIFKALLASDDNEKPGTMEKVFNDIEETRDKWCNSPNVYEQEGEMLEKTISLFSYLTRLFGESDDSLKYRNKLLFCRNGDTIWGNKWNILRLFKVYFETEFVYIVNNTNESKDNLIQNGDFEMKNAWTLKNCFYDQEARFCDRTGMRFNFPASCKQTVILQPNSTYFLHFFVKGFISVEIKDNNDRYWNGREGEFGEWQSAPCLNPIPVKTDWDAASVFFLTDEAVQGVTISFAGGGEYVTYLDYVRLFKKENYSSFTLVVNYGGYYTQEAIAMAPGTRDPMLKVNGDEYNVDYGSMSYFEQSHLFGVEGAKMKSVCVELLESVGPGGITHYIEILTKEDVEE